MSVRATSFRRILLGLDGSAGSFSAFHAAAGLADRLEAEVTVLHVILPGKIGGAPLRAEYNEQLEREAEKQVEKAASLASKRGLRVKTKILHAQASVVQEIVEYAAEVKSDLIVLGRRGTGGFRRMLLGSVSSGVVARAHSTVLVVRPRPSSEDGAQFKRIQIAVDGSEHAKRAVSVAVVMANALVAEVVTALNVLTFPWFASAAVVPIRYDDVYKVLKEEGKKATKEAAEIGENVGVGVKTIVKEGIGSPVRTITEYAAKEGVDLIVTGTRGQGGFGRLLLGSVASGVLNYATRSVLVVR